MELTDLTGIKFGNAGRLASMGITTTMDFYLSPIWKLKAAFHSITGYYWYLRLRGYEVDEIEFGRKSYGNSVAIGRPVRDLTPILTRLVEKMSSRVRAAGYRAGGIHLSLVYKDRRFWHRGKMMGRDLFDTRDFLREALILLREANPVSPVGNIAISCFSLSKVANQQTELFADVIKKEELAKACDSVNEKWGDFTLSVAKSFKGENLVLDRIAFGGVKEL
jgi:DNA polymerase-4